MKEETLKVSERQILIYNSLTGTFSLETNTAKTLLVKANMQAIN